MATALLHNRVFSMTPKLPTFTYTGEYSIVEEDAGWKIRFLTSGTLTITSKDVNVDVFLVGGGAGGVKLTGPMQYWGAISGGGGGSGYTTTVKKISLLAHKEYEVIIGAGGSEYNAGGASSFDGSIVADGGSAGYGVGGNGGSGGGCGTGMGGDFTSGAGGVDGDDGGGTYGGAGQGTTTREFGEPDGKLYATGGDGGGYAGGNGEDNTGDGGNGADYYTTAGEGGSGIVIIRNARG